MIAPLRRVHRWSWIVLTLIIAAVIAVAVESRRTSIPRNTDLVWENPR
jgi:hypothetical protein